LPGGRRGRCTRITSGIASNDTYIISLKLSMNATASACAVTKLRFGIGQRDPVGLGVEVKECIILPDRYVRFCRDGNDLARDLRADRDIHRLNIGIFLRDIAAGREVKA
jgi:hypothetical protein